MCEIFNCELGYLLCEYDCKNKIAADVQTVTGLSEKAVMILHDMKTSDIRGVISVLNGLIEHPDFSKLLCAIYTHTENFNKKHSKLRMSIDWLLRIQCIVVQMRLNAIWKQLQKI